MTVLHRVRARNLATTSTNKIHDDEVARDYGFRGGLVPGVDVYAYMTRPALERFGDAWLRDGRASVRFVHPVYDGDWTTVEEDPEAPPDAGDAALHLVARDPGAAVCARATAAMGAGTAPRLGDLRAEPLPTVKPTASTRTLAAGTVLGTCADRFDADAAAEYLEAIGDDLPLYRAQRVAHPGWLLRRANTALSANVAMGPWIHVGSDVALFDTVDDGDPVMTHARVEREWEQRGHKFVTIDVIVAAGAAERTRVAMHAAHTAIYEPRRQTD